MLNLKKKKRVWRKKSGQLEKARKVDVLQQGGELVFLTGPPGTGKTLMLLRETARQIFGEQASDALRKHVGEMYAERVHIHLLDLSQESCTAAGVEQLVAARTGGVVREVGEARDIQSGYVSSYTHPTAPAPCDGPPVIYIEHKKDQDGHSGRVLREAGYPVLIVESNDTGGIGELAAMIGPDVITMTHVDNIWGLERKVVVMFGINPALDDAEGRLYGMSRSTAQADCSC
nr:hypothetical protein BaRGS_031239 [Batillaria attramentaria]